MHQIRFGLGRLSRNGRRLPEGPVGAGRLFFPSPPPGRGGLKRGKGGVRSSGGDWSRSGSGALVRGLPSLDTRGGGWVSPTDSANEGGRGVKLIRFQRQVPVLVKFRGKGWLGSDHRAWRGGGGLVDTHPPRGRGTWGSKNTDQK